MPRLRDEILDCVVYLYPSKHEALEGMGAGGSGFLIRVPTTIIPESHFNFVVTNRHVVDAGQKSAKFVRLNTKDGDKDVIEISKDRLFVSEKDDLAIILMPTIPMAYTINSIPVECLVSKAFVGKHGIGVGDDILMVGRFVNREGKQRNSPTARFGHIAQMMGDSLSVDIAGKEHVQEDAILGEVRSIGGYSGSPVFVIPNTAVQRPGEPLPTDRGILLGIDFCHIRSWVKARDQHMREVDHFLVPQNTGMAGIIPAWKLEELLRSDKVKKNLLARETAEMNFRNLPKASADSVGVSPAANDANPTHREDFTRLVGAAARKPEPKD